MSELKRLDPVDAIEPIREIDHALETLLAGLDDDAWRRPAVKEWCVRDVAAHLLDTNLRRLSLDRDAHQPEGIEPPTDPESFESWVEFLNRLNAEWTRAAQRLSPSVIVDLLRTTNAQVASYFESLDPGAPATFGVKWAHPSDSRVWLDVAREYTEKWHHQQQIRDAVEEPGLDAPHLLEALIESLLRAVPLAYDAVDREVGTSVRITASDLDGASWLARQDDDRWNLYTDDGTTDAHARIAMPSGAMWRFLMKQMPRDDARARADVSGDPALAAGFFEAIAVMA